MGCLCAGVSILSKVNFEKQNTKLWIWCAWFSCPAPCSGVCDVGSPARRAGLLCGGGRRPRRSCPQVTPSPRSTFATFREVFAEPLWGHRVCVHGSDIVARQRFAESRRPCSFPAEMMPPSRYIQFCTVRRTLAQLVRAGPLEEERSNNLYYA